MNRIINIADLIEKISKVEGSYGKGKCAARTCNHPLDPPEWDCGYNTTIECEECKYCLGSGGRKDPEAKCNQQK